MIGIFEFGGGLRSRDLEQFCNDVGVSVPKVKVVSVDDTPQDPNDLNVSGEVMLDVEVIAGACPGAAQVVYFGSPQFDEKAWVDILGMAIHDDDNKPFILSISYGLNEDDAFWQEGSLEKINESFQEAAMMGITVCVSAGDDGSAAETDMGDPSVLDGMAHVEFPASSPFVLSVGGTDLRFNNGSVTEVTWKDGNGRRFFQGGTGTGGADRGRRRRKVRPASVSEWNNDRLGGPRRELRSSGSGRRRARGRQRRGRGLLRRVARERWSSGRDQWGDTALGSADRPDQRHTGQGKGAGQARVVT